MTDSDRSDKREELSIDTAVMVLEDFQTQEWCSHDPDLSEAYEALNAVPIYVLEGLADEWRNDRLGTTAPGGEYESAANELQEVINDYGDTDE